MYRGTGHGSVVSFGIKGDLLRFAVGTEDLNDLIADLDQALAQV